LKSLSNIFSFEQTPTSKPSKSYAFDFKGKIAARYILRFHQLSGPIGRFLHLAAFDGALKPSRKYRHHSNLGIFFVAKSLVLVGLGGCAVNIDFIGFFVGQNQKSSRIVPYGLAPAVCRYTRGARIPFN
jgi:hypothetical protein